MAPSQSAESGQPMRPASDIPRTNAAGFEHSELVEMIAGVDGAQVHELGLIWDELGGEVINLGASLQGIATSSESFWIGQAGAEARNRLGELVTWCQGTGEKMQHMGTTVMRTQAEAAETAQMSMPAPVPYDPAAYQNRINSTSNPAEWAQILGDARDQAARHDAAHAEAVRVVETYSTSLHSTNGAMPAFIPPPEIGDREPVPDPGEPGPGVPGPGVPAPGIPAPGGDDGTGSGGAGGGPGGGSPGGDGHRPDNQPPASTPGQLASSVPSSHGPTVPAGGSGGTGSPGLLAPVTAGIGGAAARGPGVGSGRDFGPRGSGVSNVLGRGGPAAAGGAEGASGAGRAVTGMAGRGPGVGPGAGGAFPPMVGGGRGQGAEDTERRRPSYLVETEDIWGDGQRVAPAVIGEDPPESDRRGAQ